LLNTLTQSTVLAEKRMFATLDPTSRRLRLPHEQEVILNDTVGFIRDLPPDLIAAFRATLEEISDSNVLIHLLDAANPRWEQQLESVEKILTELELNNIPRLVVFNKADLVDRDTLDAILRQTCATGSRRCVSVSAPDPRTLRPMLEAVGSLLARDLTTHYGSHDNSEDRLSDDSSDAARADDEINAVEHVEADAAETSRVDGEIREADEEDLEYAARIAR
jgi:GTP-binding protein HflX